MEENDKILWVDVETTGLEDDDQILEFGAVLTSGCLRPIIAAHAIFNADVDNLRMTQLVWDMHTANGLLAEIRSRKEARSTGYATIREVPCFGKMRGIFLISGFDSVARFDHEVARLLREMDAIGAPLGGSNVGSFDRSVMRNAGMMETLELLHYRCIDTSTVRGLLRRWCPGYDRPPKSERHRVFDDLHASIETARMAQRLIQSDLIEWPVTTDFEEADVVGEWHDREPPPNGRELHEFIGWTWPEYQEWGQWSTPPPFETAEAEARRERLYLTGEDSSEPEIDFNPDFTPADTDAKDDIPF
ncbi:MAG: hypothetical protein K0U16_07560 [Gammaproteobacteria bacterium]|nr:hypothetical protein [Gammaproteobacteria bacterium]